MKSISFLWLTTLLLSLYSVAYAQDNSLESDSASGFRSIPIEQVPPPLLSYVDTTKLYDCSALFIFNHSLHPLGKMEFMDSNKIYNKLNRTLKMNRCTLVYVDSGRHKLHTMYQRDGTAVEFNPGSIYFAELFTRTHFLVPAGIHYKNKEGEEFGAVLFYYIGAAKGTELLSKLKKIAVLLNE
ncbi:hypothetical protein BH10BAC3_BH10BAC3_33400 [soil metagenome]